MVDSVKGAGGVQGLQATNKTQPQKSEDEKKSERSALSAPVQDEVTISQEALSLAQAEETAKETRQILEQNRGESLSSERNRVDSLL